MGQTFVNQPVNQGQQTTHQTNELGASSKNIKFKGDKLLAKFEMQPERTAAV